MNAPKNKTSETANPVERRVAAVNPFNMLNHNTQGAIDQQHQQAENKRIGNINEAVITIPSCTYVTTKIW